MSGDVVRLCHGCQNQIFELITAIDSDSDPQTNPFISVCTLHEWG